MTSDDRISELHGILATACAQLIDSDDATISEHLFSAYRLITDEVRERNRHRPVAAPSRVSDYRLPSRLLVGDDDE